MLSLQSFDTMCQTATPLLLLLRATKLNKSYLQDTPTQIQGKSGQ